MSIHAPPPIGQEVHQMLDLYAAGAFAPDPTDPRNLFHERALHEARIASEYREIAAARPHASSGIRIFGARSTQRRRAET